MYLNRMMCVVLLLPGAFPLARVAHGDDGDEGACCNVETGACTVLPQSECQEQGGIFQGVDTFCRACAMDPMNLPECSADAECWVCVYGDEPDYEQTCVDNSDCLPDGVYSDTRAFEHARCRNASSHWCEIVDTSVTSAPRGAKRAVSMDPGTISGDEPWEHYDYNFNCIPDYVEILYNPDLDRNENHILDECEVVQDCDEDGIPECHPDCNENVIGDACDIKDGTSEDCTGNGIPDECEPDCNNNGKADSCDIADCDGSPWCSDCNENGIPDECDIDSNNNDIPDECEGACCIAADGTCNIEEWDDCKDHGNFQGLGTYCYVCLEDPLNDIGYLPYCYDDADCKICIGGDNEGNTCVDTDPDCLPGGECTYFGPCLDVPPSCAINACCDPDTGECMIGYCEDETTRCGTNSDCVGIGDEKCVPDEPGVACPEGWVDLRYGSNCDPDCCVQPDPYPGGDNCSLVDVPEINVPEIGADPVTVTITGNNSPATFDDYPDWCDREIFNPNGVTRDPGWWEAFYIDECANVRVDLCCSEIDTPTGLDVLRPAWGNLYVGCPCDEIVYPAGVEPPLGEGLETPGHGRGPTVCNLDNLWMTFGPVPTGTYYYPIYSAPDGTFASPPGGTYQLHVTTKACSVAACCANVCQGGARADELCNPDGIPECPNGTCQGGVCVNGDLDGWPCDAETGEVIQCGGGTCGNNTGCDLVNELVCNAMGGFWLAGENLPLDTEPVVTCVDVCDTGACCNKQQNPEWWCDDEVGGQPMDKEHCSGHYVGGARCNWAPPDGPCGPCTLTDTDDNNSCTNDCCDPVTGTSYHLWLPAGIPCEDEGDPCTDDKCGGGEDIACIHGQINGRECDDDADCGSVGKCVGGNCDCQCFPSSPAVAETLALTGDPINQKIRYLSFSAGDPGRSQAIRVTFESLGPAAYSHWTGTQMWVQQPEVFCENAGQVKPPPQGCMPAEPRTTWMGATLGCSPHYMDWSTLGVIHVYHEGIMPSDGHAADPRDFQPSVYEVQVIDSQCNPLVEANYSDPLEIRTSKWGDVVRDCTTCPCGPPDCIVTIPDDVTAILEKFKNLTPPTIPCYAVVKVRADLDWCTPNQRVDISDVTFCLDAFRGVQYPPPAFEDCITPEPPCGGPPLGVGE